MDGAVESSAIIKGILLSFACIAFLLHLSINCGDDA